MEAENKLKNILSKVLGLEVDRIDDNSSPSNISNWDSFNGIVLVTELEKEFKVKFTMEEVIAVKNVRDIKNSLNVHGIKI